MLISIFPIVIQAVNLRTINPYSILIGNCAIDGSKNIYTINPASIGLLKSSMLFQNYTLNRNSEKMYFSQNIMFKQAPNFSLLIGHTLMDRKIITTENNMFRVNQSINIGNVLYLGANFTYNDKNYKKFHKSKLTADLGMIISLNFNSSIKFINIGVYGLDSKIEKISLDFPNHNYGRYSVFGLATGLKLYNNLDAIFSLDTSLISNNTVLSKKSKTYKCGNQLNFSDSSKWLSINSSGEYLNDKWESCSAGINIDFNIFGISYGIKYDLNSYENQQYSSITFPLGSKLDISKNVSPENKKDKGKIRISYYKNNDYYIIGFLGNKDNISFWNVEIVDEDGNTIRNLSMIGELPQEIIWDKADSEGIEVPDGIYTIKLSALKDILEGTLFEIIEDEKQIIKGIFKNSEKG